jgi:serine/threonine protein kinase
MMGALLDDRYRLERKLGEGGMGVVYGARDEQVVGETFAIKVLKPEIRELPEALDLVREEVRKTRSLAHPNIVGVYSVNIDQHNVFILMEYLVGKPLNTLLDEDFGRGMPFDRAWPLIQDICAGLAYAHDHSVVHSDLKPSNIFITSSGKAKLLDFGIARAARGGIGRLDPGTLGALTPAYASCEMLEGEKPDQRDDVYSLGCVIYEMLSGKLPFDRPTAVEARAAGLAVPKITSLSDAQNAALAAALSFDRKLRTQTVEALLAGLDRNARLPPAKLKIPIGVKAGSAAALLLFAALGIFLWHRASSPSLTVPASTPREPGSAVAVNEVLAHVQSVLDTAARLEVDPSDMHLQQGTQLVISGRQHLAEGDDLAGERLLAEAEQALRQAVRQGNRLAHVGSPPEQITRAMSLCAQGGAGCSPGDFSDEKPRTVSLSPFAIDQTEVTNRDFADFAARSRYSTGGEREGGLYVASGNVAKFRPGESWKTLRDALRASGEKTTKSSCTENRRMRSMA